MHGRLFLACLLIFCPAQCLLTMWLITGKVPPKNVVWIAFFNMYEFSFVFVVHFLLTSYSKQVHKPARPLIGLSVANQHRIGHFRTRLRLALDIDQLNIINPYRFTYGKYGLISLDAFSKVLLNTHSLLYRLF